MGLASESDKPQAIVFYPPPEIQKRFLQLEQLPGPNFAKVVEAFRKVLGTHSNDAIFISLPNNDS